MSTLSESQHFECPNCGASVDLPLELISSHCAFCDTPVVKSNVVKNKENPEYVAQFMIDQWAASNRLQAHIAKTWFVSSDLKKNAIQKELKGVLVPFWAYDAHARSSISCSVGIWWYETEIYTEEENGETVTKTRMVQHTECGKFNEKLRNHYTKICKC